MCKNRYTKNGKFEFDNLFLENSTEDVVLGVTIENKLAFDCHNENICRKAGQKILKSIVVNISNKLS